MFIDSVLLEVEARALEIGHNLIKEGVMDVVRSMYHDDVILRAENKDILGMVVSAFVEVCRRLK